MASIKRILHGIVMSMSMFTSIPMPHIWDDKAFSVVGPSLPLVGAVIGGIWFGLALLLKAMVAPMLIFAVLAVLIPLFLSGFIHIDGYMDTSDAFFSRGDLEKKRAILKDSHVGAFAVIALAVYFMLAVSSMYTVAASGTSLLPLILIPVMSRAIAGIMLLNARPMSQTGFGATFKQNTRPVHTIVLAVFLLLGFVAAFFCGITAVLVLIVLVAVGVIVGIVMVDQFDGISGDLCGFIITVSEVTAMLIWALM